MDGRLVFLFDVTFTLSVQNTLSVEDIVSDVKTVILPQAMFKSSTNHLLQGLKRNFTSAKLNKCCF